MKLTFSILMISQNQGEIDLIKHLVETSEYSLTYFSTHTAKEALNIIDKNSIHLLIVDYMVDTDHGIDFIKVLRTNEFQNYILYLTDFDQSNFVNQAFKSGVDEYHTKDELNNETINRICRAMIQKKEQTDQIRLLQEQVYNTQKLEALGALTSGVAHDFNNLLTAIMGNADLALSNSALTHNTKRYLENIKNISNSASDLSQYMLSYTGKGKLETKLINLSTLASEMERFLSVAISKKVFIKYELDNDLGDIYGDESQIQQMIENIISNASEAIGENSGCITLTTGVTICHQEAINDMYINDQMNEGEYAYFEISDTGIGMSKRIIERIFDPFYTTKHSARGLGMASVLGIVRSHKGGVSIDSTEGIGTTFRIYFPLLATLKKKDTISADVEFHDKATVLIVDDEPFIRESSRNILESYGYNVVLASNGQDAYELYYLNQDDIDIIIMDNTMPVLDGIESIKMIRKMNDDVCIILTSGYNRNEVAEYVDLLGIDNFIKKPFYANKIYDVVNQHIPLIQNRH